MMQELHDMMADHSSMEQCEKCTMVLGHDNMELHKRFNCDDDQAIQSSYESILSVRQAPFKGMELSTEDLENST